MHKQALVSASQGISLYLLPTFVIQKSLKTSLNFMKRFPEEKPQMNAAIV